jgi:hypothetical protein
MVVSRPMTRPPRRSWVAVLLILTTGLASACDAAALPGRSSSTSPSSLPTVVPTADPGPGGQSGGDAGSGGDTGSGVVVDPVPVDPGAGQPTLVVPKPGQKNPHPVSATKLEAAVDGRHVFVKITWYSGVEPCNVLDSVKVERSGPDIALSLIEGASALDVACIEIAQLKATIVDLGELEPGSYTVRSSVGEAPPIQITIT